MHKRPTRILIPVFIILAGAAAGIWYFSQEWNTRKNNRLEASGTVEAVEIAMAPEVGGRVVEVLVDEGDAVQPGDILFRLDDETLQAQRARAVASLEAGRAGRASAQSALELAKAGLETARASVESAQVQVELAVKAARLADQAARAQAWKKDLPTEFTQPAWYFRKSEEIQAANEEMLAAQEALNVERLNFERTLQDTGNASLQAAEIRLAKAQAAYLVAQDVLDRAEAQPDKQIRDYAQNLFEAAKAELNAAQAEFERLLSEQASADLQEARARLAVAEERFQTARDRLDELLTGDESLQVRAAQAAYRQAETLASQAEVGVRQAEAAVKQAEQVVAQTQAELDLIDVQLSRLVVRASTSGVVTSRHIEPGEVVQPGAIVLTISQLDRLTITVYLNEDRYGQVGLGEQAQVTVDSFPGQAFAATVVRIADRAEFTPRNVQTEEGRRTTVFAVKLAVEDPQGRLKPGMPADVRFLE